MIDQRSALGACTPQIAPPGAPPPPLLPLPEPLHSPSQTPRPIAPPRVPLPTTNPIGASRQRLVGGGGVVGVQNRGAPPPSLPPRDASLTDPSFFVRAVPNAQGLVTVHMRSGLYIGVLCHPNTNRLLGAPCGGLGSSWCRHASVAAPPLPNCGFFVLFLNEPGVVSSAHGPATPVP